MADKAYIVANEEQELRVLHDLEMSGSVWADNKSQPTAHLISDHFASEECFPYSIILHENKEITVELPRKNKIETRRYKIVYDGRKESKMKISKEVYDALVEWKEECLENKMFSGFVGETDIKYLPEFVGDWWKTINISAKKSNNRLIAIIRWVNGEDVFEVQKTKKWVVRSKGTDRDGDCGYVALTHDDMQVTTYNIEHAATFDTRKEAESWANAHQEVIEVEA